MFKMAEILKELSAKDAREVIYFAGRYFKGSPHIESGGKEFFADVFDREPDPRVYDATLRLIEHIESVIGKKAPDFDIDTDDLVLSALADFEIGLEPNVGQSSQAEAEAFFAKFAAPNWR